MQSTPIPSPRPGPESPSPEVAVIPTWSGERWHSWAIRLRIRGMTGANGEGQVADPPGQMGHGLPQIDGAVGNARLAEPVGRFPQDVHAAHPGQGVAEGVEHHVPVAVGLQRGALHRNASQQEGFVGPRGGKAVAVLAQAGAQGHRRDQAQLLAQPPGDDQILRGGDFDIGGGALHQPDRDALPLGHHAVVGDGGVGQVGVPVGVQQGLPAEGLGRLDTPGVPP